MSSDAILLEKRLLGAFYGRAGIWRATSDDPSTLINKDFGYNNNTGSLEGQINLGGENGYVLGIQNPKGKEEIHASFPDEIEYYSCAFELIDINGKTIDYFQFPLMPSSISITRQPTFTIKKTNAGVVVNNNPTFVPFSINLSGNFGRKFRKYFKAQDYVAELNDVQNDIINDNQNSASGVNVYGNKVQFSKDYKTGYGFNKKMEAILETSRSAIDSNGKSYRLVFYNLSFNQMFIVEVENYQFAQSRDMNAIWQYSVVLSAVAPASALFSTERLRKSLSKMMNFSKKSNEFGNQSEGIMSLLNPDGFNTSKARRILEKQIKSRAFNAIGDTASSGITVIQQMLSNPNNLDDFIVNIGNGVLNKF